MWKLFTTYFEIGMIPSTWLKAVVSPIPKGAKKDPYTPLNYRGISLLSCVYKVYSGILNTRVVNYCEMLDIFVEEQNGFRRGRSCQDHKFSLTSIIQDKLDKKEEVFTAFIDLEKAFDWVDRELLFFRLLQYNIDGKMYNAIKSFYTQCESCIRLNSLCSEWFPVNSGVRQGDNISSTLFSLYINELAKEINAMNVGVKFGHVNLSILLYADDMVLVANNEKDLQSMLDKMHEWCSKWRLKVNQDKSNIVHFRSSRKPLTNFQFKYGVHHLNTVSEYKYLGVLLDQHLKFSSCSKTLADSGGRALSAVISKFKQFKDIGFTSFTKMFNSCVVPVLDYGSEIWAKAKVNHSDSIQNKAYRYFLGVHKFTPIPAMQAEMGWLPCKQRKQLNILRFWNRLIKMSNDRITKQIFNIQFRQETPNSWCASVKDILLSIDKEDIYLNKEVCDLYSVEELLYKSAEKEWKEAVDKKPKLRTFKTFKKDFRTSDYIKWSINRYDRSLFAKFRCGILQLRIETGRFNNTKLEDRTCELCNDLAIEDELHFLCVCELYKDIRVPLLNKACASHPHFNDLCLEEKFTFLVVNCSRDVIKFIKAAWEVRKQELYK